jgi:hypothetical protein
LRKVAEEFAGLGKLRSPFCTTTISVWRDVAAEALASIAN